MTTSFNDKKNLFMYRIMSQAETFNMTGMTTKAVTFEEAEKDAAMFCSVPTKPYVILPICTEKEWNDGAISFCPRCGHKHEVALSSDVEFECDDCGSFIQVIVHSFSELPTNTTAAKRLVFESPHDIEELLKNEYMTQLSNHSAEYDNVRAQLKPEDESNVVSIFKNANSNSSKKPRKR